MRRKTNSDIKGLKESAQEKLYALPEVDQREFEEFFDWARANSKKDVEAELSTRQYSDQSPEDAIESIREAFILGEWDCPGAILLRFVDKKCVLWCANVSNDQCSFPVGKFSLDGDEIMEAWTVPSLEGKVEVTVNNQAYRLEGAVVVMEPGEIISGELSVENFSMALIREQCMVITVNLNVNGKEFCIEPAILFT